LPILHFYQNKNFKVQVLHNNEIDKLQWDECINVCPDGLIYAKSFYLDNICPGWKALTGEKYEWVLPVTDKTKFGISYLYQPPFTQQLGIFAKSNIIVPYEEIIQWLKQHYKFWEVNWNYAIDIKSLHSLQTAPATNFILNLSHSYESTKEGYHNVLIKNLKRSKHFHHHYKTSEDFNKCIDLYRKYYGNRISHVKSADYNKFSNICYYALQHNMLHCRQVTDDKAEVLAMTLLLFDGRRLYNIINVTTEAGRKIQANHFLLDSIIHEFSGRDLLFDFEGSDLPGVKLFYENFGAVSEPYYMIKYNALPLPLKLFKK
jgi:hypothetical protein